MDMLNEMLKGCDDERASLQAWLKDVERETIEKCAKVADDHAAWARDADLNYGGEAFARGAERAANYIAQAIRSLKPTETAREGES